MTKFRYAVFVGLIVVSPWTTMPVAAQVTELDTSRFGYTGSYTTYSTLTDAQNGSNSIGGGTIGQTDLSMYFLNNLAGYPNANGFLTAWYYTTTGPSPGDNNPNNQITNYIQIADYTGATGSSYAYWSNTALTQFTFTASGSNANYDNSYARFQTALGDTSTTFVSYNLNAVFSGLQAATWNAQDGAYESYADTANMSVNGMFTAIAYNSTLNQYFDINLTLNTTSWTYDNAAAINAAAADNGSLSAYYPSFFGASVIIPEPSSLTIVGLVGVTVLGYCGVRRVRARAARFCGVGPAEGVGAAPESQSPGAECVT